MSERRLQPDARREALQRLWGRADYFTRRSMDVYLHKLRKHLAADPSVHLRTIRGRGVMLSVEGQRG